MTEKKTNKTKPNITHNGKIIYALDIKIWSADRQHSDVKYNPSILFLCILCYPRVKVLKDFLKANFYQKERNVCKHFLTLNFSNCM